MNFVGTNAILPIIATDYTFNPIAKWLLITFAVGAVIGLSGKSE